MYWEYVIRSKRDKTQLPFFVLPCKQRCGWKAFRYVHKPCSITTYLSTSLNVALIFKAAKIRLWIKSQALITAPGALSKGTVLAAPPTYWWSSTKRAAQRLAHLLGRAPRLSTFFNKSSKRLARLTIVRKVMRQKGPTTYKNLYDSTETQQRTKRTFMLRGDASEQQRKHIQRVAYRSQRPTTEREFSGEGLLLIFFENCVRFGFREWWTPHDVV